MSAIASITPSPTDEEAALIAATVEALWPKPVVLVAVASAEPPRSSWRFSGRWWARPISHRRDRPYR